MSLQLHPLSSDVLNSLDMMDIYNDACDANGEKKYILSNAGEEHYRLLAHIARTNNGKKFLDIGTFMGWSALALASNPNNKVVTYDIQNWFIKSPAQLKPNLTYKIGDILENLNELKDTDLILLDVNPHDGIKEKMIIDKFIEAGYKGAIIMDDINHPTVFPTLATYYKTFTNKEDLTKFGHATGTGIVYLS